MKRLFLLAAVMATMAASSMVIKPVEVSAAASAPKIDTRRPELRAISEDSKDEIRQFVSDHADVEGVQVLAADFIRNERSSTFVSHKDPVLQADWDAYAERTKGGRAPLFSADVDEESRIRTNTRFSRVINGEFVCLHWKDTLGFRVLADSFKSRIFQFCQQAIPPDGPFAGYFGVYVTRELNADELKKLELEIEALGWSIWLRDIKK